MGAIIELGSDELDVMGAFFAPVSTDMISGMVSEYRQARGWIEQVADFSDGDVCKAVINYFLSGNATSDRGRISMSTSAAQLFRKEGAFAALNATYWSKALNLTDVYDAMPQARRNQWNEQIRNPEGVKKHRGANGEWETPPLPDFEEETVRATLQDLLSSRAKFLAERVDGIFRALSGEHVTNSPAAFGKRMIVAGLVTSYNTTAWERVGFINDLRCVIAKFMGRDEPKHDASSGVVERARRERRGEWVTIDGGALRLRAYKCGTAHLEVHPDMAWRLNCVLANLYPLAIPPEFRQKPKKKPKDFVMMGRPLPFAVIAALESLETAYNLVENTGPDAWKNKYLLVEIKNALKPRNGWGKSVVTDEAERVIAYIGGVKQKNDHGSDYFAFDYNPREVIAEIICSGCLPDQKAHQYYPTPENVAEAAIELAKIGDEDQCLEPSAGTGGLADLMPMSRTLCIEISALHCKVLEAKGHNVIESDFLRMPVVDTKLDRIVMNPPFSEGRWKAHVEHAAQMLAHGGRLVAVLPASASGKEIIPGFVCEWSRVFSNEFAGTSIDVVILVARRAE